MVTGFGVTENGREKVVYRSSKVTLARSGVEEAAAKFISTNQTQSTKIQQCFS